MHCIRGEFHKKKKKDLSSEESTCDAASHLCATAARRKRRNGTIASHQQVKEFQRQFLSRARSFAPSVVFSFPPSSLLVLATIRNGNGAQLHAFFFPPLSLQLLLNKLLFLPSTARPPSPPFLTTEHRLWREERKSYAERGVVLSAPRNSSAASLWGELINA